LEFTKAKQEYETKLNKIIEEINTKKKIYENTINRLNALRSMYKTQLKRYSQGRITQTTLNDTLIKIATEEINLVDCEYSLICLHFDYYALIY